MSRAQLLRLGLSRGGIDARVARAALHVVHAGVYAVGHPLVHGVGLDHAALLASGPGAARSHRTAAVAWDLRSWGSRTVDVIAGPGRRSKPGIRVHRHALHSDDVVELDGLPTTTVARTVFDLAEVLTREQHARVWEEGSRLRLIDVRAVRAVAARNPGRHALKVVLPLLAAIPVAGVADTRSALEADFLVWTAKHLAAFPPPQPNVWVHGFEVDAHWPHARLVVELDSRLHHDNDSAFERDRDKWAALTTAGVAVLPVTSRRLRRDTAGLARQLTHLLRSRWIT